MLLMWKGLNVIDEEWQNDIDEEWVNSIDE